jgi:hypothetical protein
MEPVRPSAKRRTNETNWEHQKEAITTDQKNRVDDEHIHEIDKRRVKESEKQASPMQPQRKKGRT